MDLKYKKIALFFLIVTLNIVQMRASQNSHDSDKVFFSREDSNSSTISALTTDSFTGGSFPSDTATEYTELVKQSVTRACSLQSAYTSQSSQTSTTDDSVECIEVARQDILRFYSLPSAHTSQVSQSSPSLPEVQIKRKRSFNPFGSCFSF